LLNKLCHFEVNLPSQSSDLGKSPVFPTNHLAATSKPNLTATKIQHKKTQITDTNNY